MNRTVNSKDEIPPPGIFRADATAGELQTDTEPADSEQRFRRNTYIVVALLVIISLFFARWQMTAGILLGGLLSIFNERWLWASTGAILAVAAATGNPRPPHGTMSKFLLRYLVIAVVAGLAFWSSYFDLLGIAIGLAAFAGAVMLEAGRQLILTFRG